MPKNRVIDAVPVALVVILLSVPSWVPIAAPFSMLHVWLWLRHPRNRSRYLIFGCVASLYLGLFVLIPLVGNQIVEPNFSGRQSGAFSTANIPSILVTLAATGILPIAYRLVSRCTLTSRTGADEDTSNKVSRGGISDLLSLSVLCSVVFYAVRTPRESFGWIHAPLIDFAVSLVFSATAIFAMRCNSERRQASKISGFLLVSVSGYLLLIATMKGLDYANDQWFGNSELLTFYYRRLFDDEHFGLAMMIVAVFPMVCRRCGIALVDNHNRVPIAQHDDQLAPIESQAVDTSQGGQFYDRLTRGFGHVAVLSMLSIVFLLPFNQTRRSIDQGYRVAGFPLHYMQADQAKHASAAWYWSANDIWTNVEFWIGPLLIDLFLLVVVWLAILPVQALRERLGKRHLLIARTVVAGSVVLLAFSAVFVGPYLRKQRWESIEGLTVMEYDPSPHVGLLGALAIGIERDSWGRSNALPRGGPSHVRLVSPEESVFLETLAMPSLTHLELHSYQLNPDDISRFLAHPRLASIGLYECDLDDSAIDQLLSKEILGTLTVADGDHAYEFQADLRYRLGRHLSRGETYFRNGFDLELYVGDGHVTVPKRVKNLNVVVPDDADSSVTLRALENVERISLRNSSQDIPPTVCKLRIINAPVLKSVHLDNCQVVDLSLSGTPLLSEVYGFWNDLDLHSARLQSLSIEGPTRLSLLSVDFSQCVGFDIEPSEQINEIGLLQLAGFSGTRSAMANPCPKPKVMRFLEHLPSTVAAYSLVLTGIELDAGVMDAMPDQFSELVLDGCRFLKQPDTEFFKQLQGCSSFDAFDFSPTDLQLSQLLENADKLTDLTINGSRLTKLPKLLRERFVDVAIDDLQLSQEEWVGFHWRNTRFLRLRNANVVDEHLLSWEMPEMQLLDLNGTNISSSLGSKLRAKWPKLELVTWGASLTSW